MLQGGFVDPYDLSNGVDYQAKTLPAALDAGLEFETQVFAVTFSTEDMKEGTSAFLEKRKPDYSRFRKPR